MTRQEREHEQKKAMARFKRAHETARKHHREGNMTKYLETLTKIDKLRKEYDL